MVFMMLSQFTQQAGNEVSDQPLDRLTPIVKSLLDNQNISFDCHSHLMTKQTLTGSYLLLRLLGKIDPDFSLVDEVIDSLMDSKKENDIDKIINILNQSDMAGVARQFQDYYAPAEQTIFTALMMDIAYGIPVKPAQSISAQVDELNRLAENAPVLPFLSVDPRRTEEEGPDNLYKLFLQAFGTTGHFAGVKCYPSLGYLPSDPLLMPIFEICEAKSIPVTAHCGGTTISSIHGIVRLNGTAYSKAWCYFPLKSDWSQWQNKPIGRSRKKKAEFLNHPLHWLPVLQAFPKLKLNLAHMGGYDHWMTYHRKGANPRLDDIAFLMDTYSGVYADFSGIPLNSALFKTFLKDAPHGVLREKALYGSDFWVNLTSGNLQESIEAYKEIPQNWRDLFEKENPRAFLFQPVQDNPDSASRR